MHVDSAPVWPLNAVIYPPTSGRKNCDCTQANFQVVRGWNDRFHHHHPPLYTFTAIVFIVSPPPTLTLVHFTAINQLWCHWTWLIQCLLCYVALKPSLDPCKSLQICLSWFTNIIDWVLRKHSHFELWIRKYVPAALKALSLMDYDSQLSFMRLTWNIKRFVGPYTDACTS